MNRLLRVNRIGFTQFNRCYAKRNDPDSVIPKNTIDHLHTGHLQPSGPIVDNKPFRLELKAGKQYSWCLCGKSKTQPLCDGTHKFVHYKIKEKPVRFAVEKDGEYWLCNCKQTKHRPFCDGTHKEDHIQDLFVYRPTHG